MPSRVSRGTLGIMAETSGDRLFKVRLACGDGARTPESLRAFSDRVFAVTKVRYDPMTLSLLERMKQGWKLEDARTLAMVDPLKRGAGWLSALDQDENNGQHHIELPDPTKDRKLTDEEIARAQRTAELERRAQAKRAGHGQARKKGRGRG